jgi:hypothetical protein
VVFADSFFSCKDKDKILTKSVPNLLSFYSSSQHYTNTYQTLLVEKNILSERVGDKIGYTENFGIYFPQEKYRNILTTQVLKGKLAIYEKAIIFEDVKLNCFVAEYSNIEKVTTYLGSETWIEFTLKDTSTLPLNTCFENKFILNVQELYYAPNFKIVRDSLKNVMNIVSQDFQTDDIQYLSQQYFWEKQGKN